MKTMEEMNADNLIDQLGIDGLSNLIASALSKVDQADPVKKNKLFHVIIHKICRIALDSGLDCKDLLEISMIIMSATHDEVQRLRHAK